MIILELVILDFFFRLDKGINNERNEFTIFYDQLKTAGSYYVAFEIIRRGGIIN